MKAKDMFSAFKSLEALDNKAYAMLNESVYEREVGAKIWDACELLRVGYFKQVTGSDKTAYELCEEASTEDGRFFSDDVGNILQKSKTHKACKVRLKALYQDFMEHHDV